MKTTSAAAALCAAVLAFAVPAATAQVSDWREPDPENTLVIDTTKGRVIVEMRPELAPGHVERVKLLARQGFYDGHLFHRVISDFMAQTGDPMGTGQGGSPLPDLRAEFSFRRGADAPFAAVTTENRQTAGFVGATPVVTGADSLIALGMTVDGKVPGYGVFCRGVVGMARSGGDVDSANSQFFLMRETVRDLDQNYTVWGSVVAGLDVVRGLAPGEPPPRPDRMERVRVLADLPPAERPRVQVMDTRSAAFKALTEEVRARRGSRFNICDVEVPSRVG